MSTQPPAVVSATEAEGSGASVRKYLDLYHRLRALSSSDPASADACWLWTGPLRGRTRNYPQVNVYCDGQQRSLPAHRVSLVAREIVDNGGSWDLFYTLYVVYSVAGFEADHDRCNNPRCINPDHLVWRTFEEHRAVTIARQREKRAQGKPY